MCLSKTIGVSETYIIGKIYIATGRARAQTRDTHGLVRIRGLAHQVVEVCLAREEDGLPAQLQPVLLPQKKNAACATCRALAEVRTHCD